MGARYNSVVLIPPPPLHLVCDAMCGGLARWLRVLGVDTAYTPGIADADLVRLALAERRMVLTSDHRLLERRIFTHGELASLLLPVGLHLTDQIGFAVEKLGIQPGFPRCSLCNGELERVSRADVADIVPARSLIWAREFYRCRDCGHVFWEGTHWRRIREVRASAARLVDRDVAPGSPPGH